MTKPLISFTISALILFLSLTCLVYDLQLTGKHNLIGAPNIASNHHDERPNFQAILSDILGPDVVEPPSTIKRLDLLDIALIIIALASAVFMIVFAYILASMWLRREQR